MPGVIVQTGTIPAAGVADRTPGSAYFVAGLTERGDPTQPVIVRSMAEYQRLLGNRVSYGALYDDLTVFFAEGGTRAHVARVVGPAATIGLLSLNDRGGTPQPTLRVTARSPGAWSANVTVQIVDSALTNQYKLQVFYSGVLAETLGPFPDPSTAASLINAQSAYLTATNLASTNAAPTNNPAVVGPVALSAGSDDRGSVTGSTYIAALALFAGRFGSGMVAVPGQDASIVGSGLIAHAAANNRIAILSPVAGATASAVTAVAASFRGAVGSSSAGFFWPWVQIPDGVGGTRTIPPDGFVAGVRSRTQVTDGPWQAPAGRWGLARYIVGLETLATDATGDQLNADSVNVIRPISGYRLYGWRSLSTDTVNFLLLTGRDVMNYISSEGKKALEDDVFATIDAGGQLFGRITAQMQALLEPIRRAGGLFQQVGPDGLTLIDPGYLVDLGPAVNTPQVLAANEVDVNVYVRVAPTGELVKLTVTKVAVGNQL